MILRVHRHANGLAHDPVVGQGFGPERIDLETRSSDGSGFDNRMFLEQDRSHTERTSNCQESETSVAIALHTDEPSLRNTARNSAAPEDYSLIAGETEAARELQGVPLKHDGRARGKARR